MNKSAALITNAGEASAPKEAGRWGRQAGQKCFWDIAQHDPNLNDLPTSCCISSGGQGYGGNGD